MELNCENLSRILDACAQQVSQQCAKGSHDSLLHMCRYTVVQPVEAQSAAPSPSISFSSFTLRSLMIVRAAAGMRVPGPKICVTPSPCRNS